QDATAFDLNTQVAAPGGVGNGAPNGQDGTVFLQQQTFMGLLLPDIEAPIMKAETDSGFTVDEPIRLASLLPVAARLSSAKSSRILPSARQIPDLKELIAKLQAEMPRLDRPQRRIFTYNSAIPNPKSAIEENRYLALASEKANEETDFDPIYIYDLNGNRVSMIDPTGLTNYTYDALNRLTSITNNIGQTTTFDYDAFGRRTSMTHDNGVVTNYTYDAASQLLSLVHQLGATTINSFNYTYDKVGNRETKTDNNGTANYTYDTLNRLVEAVNPLPSNPVESFTYDEVGNRVDSNQNGLSTFNDANQLEDAAAFNFSYDNNGNLIQKTDKSTLESTVFEYDAENKLIRVASLDKTVNYKYDGLGRRIEKEITETAVTTVTQYIYDQEDILLELDGSNNITARYTHGPGIDEPLIMEQGGVSFFYHADALGSVTEISDSAGAVLQSYTYSSFGKIESQVDPSFVQPYTFTAREFDPETGMYFYRARYYDAKLGRFLSEDPVFNGNEQYTYVNNNPLTLVDPMGLLSLVEIIARRRAQIETIAEALANNCTAPADADDARVRARANEILRRGIPEVDIVITPGVSVPAIGTLVGSVSLEAQPFDIAYNVNRGEVRPPSGPRLGASVRTFLPISISNDVITVRIGIGIVSIAEIRIGRITK
ncbi:MAG: hypothetical protein O7B35_11505, partial [Deltaproteobacteria bacterium]|nr:hypothetical protein [Deltaproteobacteria bacterium]